MSVLIWWISHCCVYWHQWIIPSWDSTLRRYSYFSPFQEDIYTSEKVWFGGFMYMGFSDWPALPPTVLPRRRNDAFGIYFIWQHLGWIAHWPCQSSLTVSSVWVQTQKTNSSFVLPPQYLVQRTESFHSTKNLSVLLQPVYSVSEGLSSIPVTLMSMIL